MRHLYLLMPVFQNVFDIAPVVLYDPACEVLDLEWKAVCVFYNFVIIKHITPFGDGGFLEILRPQLKLPCPFLLVHDFPRNYSHGFHNFRNLFFRDPVHVNTSGAHHGRFLSCRYFFSKITAYFLVLMPRHVQYRCRAAHLAATVKRRSWNCKDGTAYMWAFPTAY